MVCRRLICLGDELQLPPLSKSSIVVESIFSELCKRFPARSISLTTQFRMSDAILRLSNELIFSHALVGGTDEIRQQSLSGFIPVSASDNININNNEIFRRSVIYFELTSGQSLKEACGKYC